MKTLLICGSDYSKHSLILLHLIKKEDYKVNKCLIVSHYSFKRFMSYHKQFDKREFFKKLRDRVIGNVIPGVKISDEMKYVLDFQKELGITEKKVSTYGKNMEFLIKLLVTLIISLH